MLRICLLGWLLIQTGSAWALRPVAKWWAKPDTLGLKYEQLTLTTPDHFQLTSWLIAPTAQATDQHTTMVLSGGDSGNMSSNLSEAQALAMAGYRVLLFDYRGFGHSQVFAIDPKRLYYQEFVTDLRTALLAARQRFPHQRTGIIGYSMGTLLGAEVAATTKCDFLITDGYVGDPQTTVNRIFAKSQKVVTVPAEAITYRKAAPKINCPWLFIAGTEDQNTPLADSVVAVEAAKRRQHRQLLTVKCGHLRAAETLSDKEYGDIYAQAISQFLAGKQISIKG